MSNTAIVVKDVAKKYRMFDSASDRLKEALHPFSKRYHREFWALKGVSFEVPRGQTVGILGRNGSGKSTLLQIIAGIMQPTTGEVIVNGRISALLELGAGFNPEFTGHENVIFQAQVMGLAREEIDKRLPDIEAFADIGEFFDQPVKTYSSGMFMRVAFAAATSVSPDILIVDEALSVGDAKFQQKCFERLRAIKGNGTTVVIVTHDVNSVVQHCDRALLVNDGQLFYDGVPKETVNRYMDLLFGSNNKLALQNPASVDAVLPDAEKDTIPALGAAEGDCCVWRRSYNKGEFRYGSRRAEIVDYLVMADGVSDPTTVKTGAELRVLFKILAHEEIENMIAGLGVKTVDGILVFGQNSLMNGQAPFTVKKGDHLIIEFLCTLSLNKGDYFIDIGCGEAEVLSGEICSLDRRNALIHLIVMSDIVLDGTVNLGASFRFNLVTN